MDKRDEEFVGETSAVGRSFAYIASVLTQIVWTIVTTLLLIGDQHHPDKVWWDIFSFVGIRLNLDLDVLDLNLNDTWVELDSFYGAN